MTATRHAWLLALTLATVLALALGPATSASSLLRWGYRLAPTSSEETNRCVATTKIWLQELGRSGVTRLKAKFELRAPQDPGIPGTSYQTRGYYYSVVFPNDALNYWSDFTASFHFFIGNRYKIRAILVGERPSLWQRDVKTKVNLSPEVGCDGSGGIFS